MDCDGFSDGGNDHFDGLGGNNGEEYLDSTDPLEIDDNFENSNVEEPSPLDYIFYLSFSVNLRQFKGQNRHGRDLGDWDVYGDTFDELKAQLFEKVKPHLKREVMFDDEGRPIFVDRDPTQADLTKFLILLYRPSGKTFLLQNFTENQAINWKGKECSIYIHMYGNSVCTSELWKRVQKDLLGSSQQQHRDRAGAASQARHNEILTTLKDRYRTTYEAHTLQWESWAAYICKELDRNQNDLESLLSQPPPTVMIHLFRLVNSHEENRVAELHETISVGSAINGDVGRDLIAVKASFNSLCHHIDRMKHHLNESEIVKNDLQSRIDAMEMKVTTRQNVMEPINDQIRPQESQISQTFLASVHENDIPDHQHE